MVATVSNPSRQRGPSGRSPTRPGEPCPGTDPGRVRNGPTPRNHAPLGPKRPWWGSVPGRARPGQSRGLVPSGQLERGLEVRRKRRFDLHSLAAERMDEAEAGGVQELPGQVFVRHAVDAVA